MLYRHALGQALRNFRTKKGMNLRETSLSASMALGYLSEVERGQKELSSELLNHLAGALGVSVYDIVHETYLVMREEEMLSETRDKTFQFANLTKTLEYSRV